MTAASLMETLAPAHVVVDNLLASIFAPIRRTIREFAEQEIIIPNGRFKGQPLDYIRQPYLGLLYDEIDSGDWTRFAILGPSQSGKTLGAFGVPTLYHLFECQEDVICGLPDENMANAKWRKDLLPIIKNSRYADLLPTSGPGSRGGDVREYVEFQNGVTLRFMTAGAGDKGRAGDTARVLVVTEANIFGRSSEASNEGDKLSQLIARTKSFGDDARIYLECTVEDEDCRIWFEYCHGSKSRIVMPCQHCGQFVTLSRASLNGWKGGKDEIEVRTNSRFYCSKCNQPWTEPERFASAQKSRLVHDGQEIDAAGVISGERKGTLQLGFRWSGVDNQLVPAGQLGYAEWTAKQEVNAELAERSISQFDWAEPTKASKQDVLSLSRQAIQRRIGAHAKGELPDGTYSLVSFLDTGFRLCHWCVVSFDETASPRVVDYGEIEVQMGVSPEKGVRGAIAEYAAIMRGGFGPDAMVPQIRAVDSGHGEMTETIYAACREFDLLPSKGHGSTQKISKTYNAPERKKQNSDVILIGERYYLVKLRKGGKVAGRLLHFDADVWKSHAHARWITPMGEPGAAVLFNAPESDHVRFADHQVAERQYTEFVQGRGHITKWEQIRPNNHYLDTFAGCCVLGHLAGARLIGEAKPEEVKKPAGSWYANQKGRR